MGMIGFALILAAAGAGYIGEGKDIFVTAIVGIGLLLLSMIIYWIVGALNLRKKGNMSHVVFPDQ